MCYHVPSFRLHLCLIKDYGYSSTCNLFKRSNYDEPIASEFCALDYLYEVLLEIRESENCDEVLDEEIYEVIQDSSLNEKHDYMVLL